MSARDPARAKAIAVACPACKAEPKRQCQLDIRGERTLKDPHHARYVAAGIASPLSAKEQN
jgi:hypothetical protein